jgi:hypothetical protein
MHAVKQIPPWASLPDSNRPLRSEPPVWKVEKHRELAKRLEKSLPKAPETDHIGLASEFRRTVKERSLMRRTLLAIGFAVLVSMLLAPHGGYNKGRHGSVDGVGPFFMDRIPYWRAEATKSVGYSFAEADAMGSPQLAQKMHWQTFPAGWDAYYIGPVMIDMLALEIVFLCVLFAVLVNIRWRRPRER